MRRRVLLAFALAVAVAVAAVAYAAWSNTQQGHSSTRVGAAGQFTVAAGPPPGAPGGPAPAHMITGPGGSGSGSVLIFNESNVAMTLSSFVGVAGGITVSNTTGVCDPSNFLPNLTAQAVSIPLPPNATTTVELPNAISLASTAPIACAGANVDFLVSVTVTQGT